VLEITRHDHTDKSWDRFVEQHPHATVAHLAAWGSIFEGAYRHERVYLVAEESGEIAGVLPLVVNSPMPPSTSPASAALKRSGCASFIRSASRPRRPASA